MENLVIGKDTCTGLYRDCSKLATVNQSVQQYHHRELGLVYRKLAIECQGSILHYYDVGILYSINYFIIFFVNFWVILVLCVLHQCQSE